jgi:hypothetical protein
MQKRHIQLVCRALKQRHIDSWAVAAVTASYVYKARQGNQPARDDGKITAKEFEREIRHALEENPAYVGVPSISDTTITRFRQAWQLAAKDGVVADADTIPCGRVPDTRAITADFDGYLAPTRNEQSGTFDDPVTKAKKRMSRLADDLTTLLVEENEDLTGVLAKFSREGRVELAALMLQDEKEIRNFVEEFARQTGTFLPEEAGEQLLLSGTTWATLMFDAIPERLHEPLFKAMARILHPDQDGDEIAMKILTQAHDRRNRRGM